MTEKENKEPKEKEEPKAKKESKKPKEKREPKAEKESKEPREKKEPKAEKESKESKEPKEKKEPKEVKEPKKPLEPKEKKEKPLDRMTAKELREMALGLEGIVGVHSMNKSELIEAIKKAKGIVEKKKHHAVGDVHALKLKIKELRGEKEAMREAGEKDKVRILRRRISRLKKKTRRVAMAG